MGAGAIAATPRWALVRPLLAERRYAESAVLRMLSAGPGAVGVDVFASLVPPAAPLPSGAPSDGLVVVARVQRAVLCAETTPMHEGDPASPCAVVSAGEAVELEWDPVLGLCATRGFVLPCFAWPDGTVLSARRTVRLCARTTYERHARQQDAIAAAGACLPDPLARVVAAFV